MTLGECLFRSSVGPGWHQGEVHGMVAMHDVWDRMAASMLDGRLTVYDANLVFGCSSSYYENVAKFQRGLKALRLLQRMRGET